MKKTIKNTRNKIAFIAFLILMTCTTFATNTTNEEEIMAVADPGSDPGAPIDSYIVPMVLLAIFVGYQLTRKKSNAIQ